MHRRKMTVGKALVSIILLFLIAALMIFTASRTVHFLQLTFPPDFGYMAYLALAAFDIGMIGWSAYATWGAEGAMQRAVAYCMIFVCLIGVSLTTIADTIISSSKNGLTQVPPYMSTIGVWGSVAVILLNVLAGIAVHLSSPHHVRKFQLEGIHDEIHAMTIQHIRESALEIAPQIAREQANHWVRVTIQDAIGGLPAPKQLTALPPVIDADKSQLVYAGNSESSREQVLDPYGVRSGVDQERKPLPKDTSKKTQKIDIEVETPVKESPTEEEPVEEGPSSDDPSKWNLVDWRQYRNEVDAWTFDATWQEYHNDVPFPDDRPTPKKRNGGKKSGNVTRRQVIGMEKQDD